MMAQVRQRPLDPSIAPGWILFGHADDELFDLLSDPRAAKLMALRASIELLRDESLVPAQERVRRGEHGDFLQARATERVSQCSKTVAFGVGQPQPSATKVGFEDAVFLLKIGDNLL